jgi:hypothetical protein
MKHHNSTIKSKVSKCVDYDDDDDNDGDGSNDYNNDDEDLT